MSVIKSCTSPLRGTLFLAPPQAGDFSIRMGFNLDSPEPVALEIHGNQIPDSAPYYFADYTVSINPGAQQVFDLFAQALNHACTFRYRATILEGKTKVYQVIGDGNEPFRVSGLRNNSAYSVMYAGGIYSPFEKGQYVRANPKTCCHVS